MPRVTADEVKEIIDTDLTDARIDAFILGATGLIDNHLLDKDINEATLKEIERWLTAHYISATFERQTIQQKAGPAEERFSDIFGKYLLGSTYGQTAISLDPSNTLEEIAMARRPIKLVAISEDE